MKDKVWDEVKKLQYDVDNMFSRFFNMEPFLTPIRTRILGKPTILTKYRQPFTNIKETDKEIIAEIEMPGVDKRDILINLTEQGIEVKTEKKSRIEKKKKGAYKLETSYVGFYKYFHLPNNADASKATADYNEGLLTIRMPKKIIKIEKKRMLEVK